MHLYEITENYRGLMELDLPEDALIDTLEAITAEFDDKAIAVGYVIKNLNGEVDAIDAEVSRLLKRSNARKSRVSSLKSYLLGAMSVMDKKKIECEVFSLTRQRGRMSVVIDNQEDLPEGCLKISVSPNKTAIKKAIDEGWEVKGAHLERGNDSLVMR